MVKRSVARVLLASVAASLIAVALYAPGATASTKQGCLKRNNNEYGKLRECVTLEGVRAHQAALQAIATANGGNRAAGTSGYDASVDYVVKKLTAAGWDVSIDLFDFTVAQPVQQHTPTVATHPTGGVTGSALRNGEHPGDADRHQARSR